MSSTSSSIAAFRSTVWNYWRTRGRHELPWRKTEDPYRILVSEIMLQQTQVPRVVEKYGPFLKAFPTMHALAKAPLADVLREWNGLGYNRRAKYLHDAAKKIVEEFAGNTHEALHHRLPGVGSYTRAAVRALAFNEPDVLIETNIRTAVIHHFYQGRSLVSDDGIRALAEMAAKGQDPRKWHWALMDYGAHLKKSGVRNNHRSAQYVKQAKFEGSLRQLRGSILRQLYQGPSLVKGERRKLAKALAALEHDGLIRKEKGKWRIA